MDDRVESVCADLRKTADDAKATFGMLSVAQLNWRPSEKGWSIAQCFDHLVTAHALYFPLLKRLEKGDLTRSFWEKYSPLSGFFGRFLIKSLDPKNPKRFKTTAKGQPSKSEIDGEIIERFYEHQLQMIEYLQKLPPSIDSDTFKITSPLLGFATYTLGDALTFLPMHCHRHFDQAKRVMEEKDFPIQMEANYAK
ncbi:MAG TPA: DinB family protein [Pyrinomonadaceae bacterium]|nr:DinB family protein [Pyrinomonadaceae bacterium]